jgi:hypothetical protein
MRFLHLSGSVALATLVAACGSVPLADRPVEEPFRHGGAQVIVLEDAQLQRASGSLLHTLTGVVSQLRVRGRDICPRLEMRGRNSIQGPSDPSVYLDGTMAGNTCLLEQLRSADVRRVEVYPMGVTSRPGYRASSGGLILLFSRDARH